MTPREQLIHDVLVAADGEIIGRIRLQKIFYLLEQSGLGSNLKFHYHHYGPYSRELETALTVAELFGGVEEDVKYRQVDGMPYSVVKLTESVANQTNTTLGNLTHERAHRLVQLMKGCNSTVLELAATIHWLVKKEEQTDWRSELVRRKGVKTHNGRTDEAMKLLEDLELSLS